MTQRPDGTHERTTQNGGRLAAGLAPGGTVPGLSSWVLERKLGGGGFGEVWLARHAWSPKERPRAVKFCTDPAARHRLVTHEKNVVLRVMRHAGEHPHVVPLLDCNLDGDAPWLMYEYVAGGTLADAVGQWRALPLPRRLGKVVPTLYAIAGALAAFHRLAPPLVHRDLKPQNVLMAGGAVPRITDFGIGGVAVSRETGAASSSTAQSARVPTGLQAAGTANYAPTEQRLGSPPHPRDDVHALGVIAYQLLTGDLRFAPGPDAADELRALRVPTDLAALVVASVAANPDRRPADAGVWEAVLADLLRRARPVEGAATAADGGSLPELLPDVPAPPADPPAVHPADEPTRIPPAAPAIGPPARPAERPARGVRRAVGVALLLVAALAGGAAFVLSRPAPVDDARESQPKTDDERKPIDTTSKRAEPKTGEPVERRPAPGEAAEVEVAPGVKMAFRWVPPGGCRLGAPPAELAATQFGGPDEAEATRGRFDTTTGFWLGQFEVTQAEWAAVMRDTDIPAPSGFQVGGAFRERLGSVGDTRRFPVETVSWHNCQAFARRATSHGGVRARFGRAGRFELPHEDEWEYACRGGRGNDRPFHWGGELNGTQANCNGQYPHGTAVAGPHLDRTAGVGSYQKVVTHPWGLCDMHGNVWEWCANPDADPAKRVQRGGGWDVGAGRCRAASRRPSDPEHRPGTVGLRLRVTFD